MKGLFSVGKKVLYLGGVVKLFLLSSIFFDIFCIFKKNQFEQGVSVVKKIFLMRLNADILNNLREWFK
jgi:hypothetical protein